MALKIFFTLFYFSIQLLTRLQCVGVFARHGFRTDLVKSYHPTLVDKFGAAPGYLYHQWILPKRYELIREYRKEVELSLPEQVAVRQAQERFFDPELHQALTLPRVDKAIESMLQVHSQFEPQIIVSSPFLRTIGTSIIVARKLMSQRGFSDTSLKIILDPRLGEPKNAIMKCASGFDPDHVKFIQENDHLMVFPTPQEFTKTFEEFAKEHGFENVVFENAAPEFTVAGQAQLIEMERATKYWAEQAKTKDILIITHDVVLRYAKHFLENGPDYSNIATNFKVDECGFFSVAPDQFDRNTVQVANSVFKYEQSDPEKYKYRYDTPLRRFYQVERK